MRKSATAEMHKRKILEVVNQLTEEELEKVSEMLKVSEALDSGSPNDLNDAGSEKEEGEQE